MPGTEKEELVRIFFGKTTHQNPSWQARQERVSRVFCGIFLLFSLIVGLGKALAFADPPLVASSEVSVQGLPGTIEQALQQARTLQTQPSAEPGVRFLETCLPLFPDSQELKGLLAESLAAQAKELQKQPSPGDAPAVLEKRLELLRRARDLQARNVDLWLALFQTLQEKDPNAPEWGSEGQSLLDTVGPALASGPLEPWVPILETLNQRFEKDHNLLYQQEIAELLAKSPAVASSAQALADDLKMKVIKRLRDYYRQADSAVSRGDLAFAEQMTYRIRRLNPTYAPLKTLDERIAKAHAISRLLLDISLFMKARDWPKAESKVQEVLRIDPRQVNALMYQQTIQEHKGKPAQSGVVQKDPMKLKKQELIVRLQAAEEEQKLSEVRKILKDLAFWGLADHAHKERLSAVENELNENLLRVEDRWILAEKLLYQQKWQELQTLLNRNPALSQSAERVIPLAEMSLMVQCKLRRKSHEELRADAKTLQEMYPQSFWVPVVLMEIEWRETKYDQAEVFFQKAKELDPAHPVLKTPERLFWLLRKGPYFMPVLIFAVIYLLIKLMPWFFGLLEESFWIGLPLVRRIFPGMALSMLESRFGRYSRTEEKIRHFEQLVQATIALKNADKGEKYALALLDLSPKHPMAVRQLVMIYSAIERPQTAQMNKMIDLAWQFPKEKGLIEKIGKTVWNVQVQNEHLSEVIRQYRTWFPHDVKAAEFLGEELPQAPSATQTPVTFPGPQPPTKPIVPVPTAEGVIAFKPGLAASPLTEMLDAEHQSGPASGETGTGNATASMTNPESISAASSEPAGELGSLPEPSTPPSEPLELEAVTDSALSSHYDPHELSVAPSSPDQSPADEPADALVASPSIGSSSEPASLPVAPPESELFRDLQGRPFLAKPFVPYLPSDAHTPSK